MLCFNIFFCFLYAFISLAFLVFCIFYGLFSGVSHILVFLSSWFINPFFLYALFFSSIAVFHFSSNHPLLSGFCCILLCVPLFPLFLLLTCSIFHLHDQYFPCSLFLDLFKFFSYLLLLVTVDFTSSSQSFHITFLGGFYLFIASCMLLYIILFFDQKMIGVTLCSSTLFYF